MYFEIAEYLNIMSKRLIFITHNARFLQQQKITIMFTKKKKGLKCVS